MFFFPPPSNLLFYLTYQLKGQLVLTYIVTYLPTIYLLETTYGSLFASSSPNKGCCCQIMSQGIAQRICKISPLPHPIYLILINMALFTWAPLPIVASYRLAIN
jgi:hypothetical protein